MRTSTVEGRLETGELTALKVAPESCRKDVILGAESSHRIDFFKKPMDTRE